MSVASLSRTASSELEFTCPHYRPVPGSKRCESYQDGGTCARPDLFLCSEWEKRNRHRLPAASSPSPGEAPLGLAGRGDAGRAVARQGTEEGGFVRTEPRAPSVFTDLFGNPLPEPERPCVSEAKSSTAAASPASSLPASSARADDPSPLRGLASEDIESFKALNVEVCLRTERFGSIWLVPRYSGANRMEISVEHVALLARVLDVFPGAEIVSFEKRPEGGS